MNDSRTNKPKFISNAVSTTVPEGWPDALDPAALLGVAGDFVTRLEPHTEGDPAAILFQFLVACGNLIGRSAHFVVEAAQQFCNMNAVLVGDSSKSRKGTFWGRVRELLGEIDPTWQRPASGMSTGEGLIWAVRDREVKLSITGPGQQSIEADTVDKRLLVVEEEFSRVLKCANRGHSTLSAVFRQAFDTGNLRILTKSNPTEATSAHISCIGHTTREELIRRLTSTDYVNGFANRIAWVCVRRSKELPEGGGVHLLDLSDIEERLRKAVAYAQTCGELRRDEEARELWCSNYHVLSAARPGSFGAVTSRAESYVVRLALLYAVLDCAVCIQRQHLEAALAAWRYCEDSARYIFGQSLTDPDANAILKALDEAGAAGLTRTQINNGVFLRHKTKSEIDLALKVLVDYALAENRPDQTEGRPAERWFATRIRAKEAKKANKVRRGK